MKAIYEDGDVAIYPGPYRLEVYVGRHVVFPAELTAERARQFAAALLAAADELEPRMNPALCHCNRCRKARGVDVDRCTYEEKP